MYEPFPGNYVWNLATSIALGTGAVLGEVLEANTPVLEAGAGGDDEGTGLFFDSWCAVGDRLAGMAAADEAVGHDLSASAKHLRASVMYLTAERMQRRDFGPRAAAYRKGLDEWAAGAALSDGGSRRVEVPYEGGHLAAIWTPARREGPAAAPTAPSPCLVFCNGLDSFKEMVHGCGFTAALARRGVSSLVVDQPGTGEALRLQELPGYAQSERWASACVDHLETLDEVDASRIGIAGWSLGGYYAPRAAAFEPRFSLCVSWGANHDWGELQRRRAAREGDRPVPHYWEHVRWVFGKDSFEDFMAFAPSMTLEGVVERIRVPYLITHGAGDRQIPPDFAQRQHDAATGSPRCELVWFTAATGGVEHVSADNMAVAGDLIADWVADAI